MCFMDQADPVAPARNAPRRRRSASREELERALSEQRRTGQKLGQLLVGQGSMTGTELARAPARQHGAEAQKEQRLVETFGFDPARRGRP
jgi:hypothetical protein